MFATSLVEDVMLAVKVAFGQGDPRKEKEKETDIGVSDQVLEARTAMMKICSMLSHDFN